MKQMFSDLQMASERRDILILLVVVASLWIPTAGLWNLWGADEGRYVQIAKELLGRDNWFLLTVHGEPYNQKPPLVFWMFAAMLKMSAGKVSSWAVRMPSIGFAFLTIFLTYGIGKKLWGHRAGLISAFVLLTTPLVLSHAPEARLDMIFSGWIALSLYPWLTRKKGQALTPMQAVLMWGALAGAFFTKGPLAIIIVLAVLLTDSWQHKSWRQVASHSRFYPGLFCVLLLIGAWFLVQQRTLDAAFVSTQIQSETIKRLLHGAHGKPIWFYLPKLFGEILIPWSLFLIPAGWKIIKSRHALPSGVISLLGWFIFPFLLLCFAHGKRPPYMLPLLPPLALLIGRQIDLWVREGRTFPLLGKALVVLIAVMAVAMITIAGLIYWHADLFLEYNLIFMPHHSVILVLVAFILAFMIPFLKRNTQNSWQLFVYAVCLMLIGAALDLTIVRPARNFHKSSYAFAQNLKLAFPGLNKAAKLGAIGMAQKPLYHVYASYRVVPLDADPALFSSVKHLPNLIMLRDFQVPPFSKCLAAAGYRKAFGSTISDSGVVVFEKSLHNQFQKIDKRYKPLNSKAGQLKRLSLDKEHAYKKMPAGHQGRQANSSVLQPELALQRHFSKCLLYLMQ